MKGTGVLIPLYIYPSTESSWNALISAKEKYPLVSITAVVNPSNGSGSFLDRKYSQGIARLKDSGVAVAGYVSTRYGMVPIELAMKQILQYRDWYAVDGLFFDEMSSYPGLESYYSELSSYTRRLAMNVTFGNAGTRVSPSYFGTVDTIIIYERPGYPTIEMIRRGLPDNFDKRSFGMIVFEVDQPSFEYVTEASSYLGYIYFTNGKLPNPFDSVSPYLESTLSFLAS